MRWATGPGRSLKDAQPQIERAAAAAKFKGKTGSSLEILAPVGVAASRLVILGVGAGGGDEGEKPTKFEDYLSLGGQTAAKIEAGAAAIVLLRPSGRSRRTGRGGGAVRARRLAARL